METSKDEIIKKYSLSRKTEDIMRLRWALAIQNQWFCLAAPRGGFLHKPDEDLPSKLSRFLPRDPSQAPRDHPFWAQKALQVVWSYLSSSVFINHFHTSIFGIAFFFLTDHTLRLIGLKSLQTFQLDNAHGTPTFFSVPSCSDFCKCRLGRKHVTH